MRITDRSPQGRRLQTIFSPAEPKPVMPSEVSDEIVLVHPAIPPMVGFKEGTFFFEDIVGVLGVNEVLGPLVPTDRYWWIQYLDYRHDDPTTRILRLLMRDTAGNELSVQTSNSVIATERQTLTRPLILPNDTRLVAQSSAIAAGQRLQLRFFRYELLHAEVNPSA